MLRTVSILTACRACSPCPVRGPDTLQEKTHGIAAFLPGLEAKVRDDPTKTSTEKRYQHISATKPEPVLSHFFFIIHLFKCLSNFRKYSSNEFHGKCQVPCYTFLAFSGSENTALFATFKPIDLGWYTRYTIVIHCLMSDVRKIPKATQSYSTFLFFCHSE